jgi:thioredoxin reductase (NADPH)
MRLPVLFAVDDDRDALAGVESLLVQRYAHDYRIESRGDPDDALRMLQELADAGEDVALVLASSSLSSASGRHLLERVRRLHPHAGRALLVPATVWSDDAAAAAIRDSMALGRIDYYVPRPPAARSTRSSTRPSRVSCSSGRGIGASHRRRCTSWARRGRTAPTS